ncbi:MAG: tRNA 5-methoxyuridine(34)/uridine 5-oxyacetic acid(34) synthase CmoB [Sedimentisphaerales bacterium]|nr:tRNA 5-methoxyuridine(34)/uridine 5-oxyacetic acid(34) synthase CmoB [Sedimentisphaerales bacterium]
MKLDFSDFYTTLTALGKGSLALSLDSLVADTLAKVVHGDYVRWQNALDSMPDLRPSFIKLDGSAIVVGTPANIRPAQKEELTALLKVMHPWRKGPFEIFGIKIDTEWRSDWKWDRLRSHISSLSGRTVLDVGCGSGYHCLRMLGDGAQVVLGIEPTLVYVMQYQAVNKYIKTDKATVLPLTLEQMAGLSASFDTIFSMGVLYHRREPLEHIRTLYDLTRTGGELVLETLVVEGQGNELLIPEGRYARMRNVWSLPDVGLLERWLAEVGFTGIRCVDISRTSLQEQRATEWMTFESLDKCLDPLDQNKTIEGLPAPTRAILIAKK